MTTDHLENLYDYHYWANERLFEVISTLPPAEYTRSVAGGHGSIRNTMVHMLSTEWGWLSRCGGPERAARLQPDAYPTVESLREQWDIVEGYMRTYLADLQQDDLLESVEYTGGNDETCAMPRGELLHHVVYHAGHHRGQVAVLLRELGYAPGEFDLLFYYAEKRGVPVW